MADFLSLGLGQKWTRFYNAGVAAHAAMTALANSMGAANATFVFLVPEYFFVHDATYGLLTIAEKQNLEGRIRSMSTECDRMVIVAGTVNYKVPVGNLAAVVAQGRANRQYAANSACLVYLNGNRLAAYHKRGNDGNYDDQFPAHDAYFVPGTGPATFNVGTIRFGIDVCLDFDQRRLVGDVPARDLDFHLYPSGTNSHRFSDPDAVAARDGGYFVHSDCTDGIADQEKRSGVWAVARARGRHGVGDGRSLKEAVSNASLGSRLWGAMSMADRKRNAVATYQASFGTGNVTRQSPLRTPLGIDRLQIFNCPV